MKKHNASKVVLVTMLLFLLLSWILPAAYFSSEYVDQGRTQMGLFDLFNYPITSLSYFGYIGFFLVLVGGFYGVLYKIPAYRNYLDKIVERVKGLEKLVLATMVVVIAGLVSICGVQVGIALFIPFFVSIILLMGYDKKVAALVVVGSIGAGLIGTTYASSNQGILTQTLALDNNYNIYLRLAILLVAIIIVIVNVLLYIKNHFDTVKVEKKVAHEIEKEEEVVVEEVKPVAKKVTTTKSSKKSSKKGSSKSRKSDNKAALMEEDVIVVKEAVVKEDSLVPPVETHDHQTWPFAIIFGLLFVLFVLAFIPWGSIGVTRFDEVTKAIKEFTLFDFPIFAKLLGNSLNAFGSWTISDLFLPMGIALTLLVLIYNVTIDEVFDGFVKGAKEALAPATIVLFLYTILVIVTYHSFQLTIYKALFGIFKGFNVFTTLIVAILCGFFNSDIVYSFQSVLPYFNSLGYTFKGSNVAVLFQTMYGFAMLFVPTSLTLMGTLAYLKISYKEWFKESWKLLLEIFIALLVLFIFLFYIVK